MSGYGPLYWPWSCPNASARPVDTNSSNITAAAIVVHVVVVAVAAVVTADDEHILQTAASVPKDQVVIR